MDEPSDEELLDRYFAGDAAAFKAFVRRHAGRVAAYAEAKGLRSEIAAEIAQDAFLRLHRSIHQYRRGCPALPWFFTIVHHLVVDTYRQLQRREEPTTNQALEALPGAIVAAAALPASALLGHLNDEQRRVVELRVVEGLSFLEMARETGRSAPSLRKTFERARRRLREVLKTEDEQG